MLCPRLFIIMRKLRDGFSADLPLFAAASLTNSLKIETSKTSDQGMAIFKKFGFLPKR